LGVEHGFYGIQNDITGRFFNKLGDCSKRFRCCPSLYLFKPNGCIDRAL